MSSASFRPVSSLAASRAGQRLCAHLLALTLAQAAPSLASAAPPRTCDFTMGVVIDPSKLKLTDPYDCVSICFESRNAYCEAQTSNDCAIAYEMASDQPEVHCEAHACKPGGLVTRRGAEFQSTEDDYLLLDVLGPIDTREEALLRVRALGYAPCAEPGDAARFPDGSWEVFGTYAQDEGTTPYLYEARFLVQPDGSAQRLEPALRRRRVQPPPWFDPARQSADARSTPDEIMASAR